MYTGNKSTKFLGNILSLSENIARSFMGATFFDSHCIYIPPQIDAVTFWKTGLPNSMI